MASNTATITHCITTSTETLRLVHILDASTDLHAPGDDDSFFGLLQLLDFVRNNQWELGDTIPWTKPKLVLRIALIHLNLAVPSAESLGRCKHATTTAHVAECTLAGTMCTTTDGNPRNSTFRTSGFSRCLMTCFSADGVCLTLIAAHQMINLVGNIMNALNTFGRQMFVSLICSFLTV